ncbi:unnamed protein product [Mytilus edulis]|uniref:Uncharacterized protein n=1 Tax=Mytilus edulis TaxID=6550 RepID=A0A8S3U802_MYTED|nr:unnamed protein product [Mytilus edulis]
MSNMDPLEQKNDQMSKDGLELDKETRLRTLTEKAQIEYDQTVTNYFSKLSTLKRNVDYEIGTYKSEDQTKESISVCQKRIENSLDKYLNMAEEISQYLKRKNTADSLRELENHESVYTNVELSADEVFRDMQRIQQRTKTKSVKSVRSNGRSSVASSTTKMKARAEAAKASLEFAAKEAELKKADAEIQRKQMDIQADLEFLSKQKEAAVAYAEYKAAMEDDDSQHDAKSLQGIPKQDELDRTRQYVESHRNVTFNSQNFRDNPVHSNTHLGDHTSAPFIPSTHQDQMPVSGPVETHDTNNPIGINPIMSKLPQSLQYKWRDKATNYKKSKNVPYPPFSFFVEFISDQASKYNDPGFKFESDQNNNSPQARDKESGRSSQRPRLSARNINVSKTEIATSTEGIKPIKLKCAIHKTNHSLNDCRSFLSKSIEDRRKIIKENGICFKCINSKDHLSRNCPENVQYQATRSVSSEDIGSSCWLQGPTKFLSGELQASASTETLTTLVNPDLDKEVRPIVTVTKTTIEDSHSIGSERFQNFSSWKSLVNGIAVLQRFIQSRFKKVTLQDIDVVKSLNESEIFIIKTIQSEVYSSEIDCIVNGQNLRKNSSIISLDPFLDSEGILRVGGRLNKSNLPYQDLNSSVYLFHIANHFSFRITNYQATRSVSSEDIGSSCWLQGPTKFLSGELQASASTETLTTLVNPDLDKEVRPIVTVTKTTIEDSHSIGSERFQNFSSWKSLVNGIAVLQRFIQSRFKKVTLQDIDVVKSLNESEIFIIKTIQSEAYSSEIDCIVGKNRSHCDIDTSNGTLHGKCNGKDILFGKKRNGPSIPYCIIGTSNGKLHGKCGEDDDHFNKCPNLRDSKCRCYDQSCIDGFSQQCRHAIVGSYLRSTDGKRMPVPKVVNGEGDHLWESDLEDPALDTLTDELDASEMHAVEEDQTFTKRKKVIRKNRF